MASVFESRLFDEIISIISTVLFLGRQDGVFLCKSFKASLFVHAISSVGDSVARNGQV